MLNLTVNNKLTFTDADKARFSAIMVKSQDVDAWSSASQYVMAQAILVAMDFVQGNLDKTAAENAQGKLDAKTKSGKPVKMSAKKRAALEATVAAKGTDGPRGTFDDKNIEASIYEAADWDTSKPKSSDGQFNKLVKRATKTAIVIWENSAEYAMQVTAMVDDEGKPVLDDAGNPRENLQPVEAAYLAYANVKKNPGKMMVDGKLMIAKNNPEMYHENGSPKMEPSGWRSLEAAYKKLHPGKTKNGGKSGGDDEEALPTARSFRVECSSIYSVLQDVHTGKRHIGPDANDVSIDDIEAAASIIKIWELMDDKLTRDIGADWMKILRAAIK